MKDSSLRQITLDSKNLEAAIDVLSSAASSFAMTRRERITYRTLMVSVDLAIVCFVVTALTMALGPKELDENSMTMVLFLIELFLCIVFVAVGTIALLLNVPIFYRTLRERAMLKSLGMTALHTSLWKASRRRKWASRIRSALIIVFGVPVALIAAITHEQAFLFATIMALFVFMIFAARHLRNQREQMDFAANAIELREALQAVRQRAAAHGTVAVSAELIERVAKIESDNISRERKYAILSSAASQSRGYAITFEDRAVGQRAALAVTDRIELEDLLAQLSTTGHPPEAPAVSPASGDINARSKTESKRVEIEYVINDESLGIRITAVNSVADHAGHATARANHA
jgi:hypothetical protein